MSDWFGRVTLDILGVTALGCDFNSIRDPHTPLIEIYRKALRPNRATMVMWQMAMLPPKWLTRLLPVNGPHNLWEAVDVARQTCRDLIHRKKIQLETDETDTRSDFISLALESNAFTEEELVNHTMTMLGAGHDTTAAAMTWTIYALCLHPSVQSRLREEIHRSIPSGTADIGPNLIDSLPYLRAVINEVLRCYPTIPIIQRAAAHDTAILGQYIPKGTVITAPPWAINYSRELWGADAEQFNPERWLGYGKANGGGAENNFAFMTFSHGPRSCIGQGFAKAELSCVIAKFVGRFEFAMKDINENVTPQGPMTAKPKNGMNIRLKVVEAWN